MTRRDGEALIEGRAIPAAAYAWYAQGVFFKQQGRVAEARYCFDQARRQDPRSGAAWAALGSSYCTEDPEAAGRLFTRGLRRADEKAVLYVARGHCALSQGRLAEAVSDAEQALAHAPRWSDGSLLLAKALRQRGDEVAAQQVETALWLYLRKAPPRAVERPLVVQIDEALARGDLARAQTLAAGEVPAGELATRALALEESGLALEQARLVHAASPGDPAARIVLALLAPEELTGLDGASRLQPQPPSPLALCLFAQRLTVAVGQTTARAWLASWEALEAAAEWRTSSDPLLSTCAERL